MGDSFSGRRILSEASLAVKAVTDLGGVTKLTEQEQRRLNATVTEALAKYRALGQQAPKDMVDLEKATRGAEQSMGGLGQSLKSVGTSILTTAAGFLTAQAAFAAVKFAVTGLVDELKTITLHGATVADVAENFDHLTASSGRLGSTLLGELRAGTHGTISDFDLMKTATQDLAAGLNLTDQQFGTLAQGAFALAQATGGDVATALETMNDAMLTGRTRSLALLTGKIDLEKAETAFARSLGATREQLSEEGKLEAARVAILDSVGGAIARLGVQTDGLDEKVAQARAQWVNFENDLGRLVATSPVIMAGLDGISAALTDAFGAEKGNLVRAIADLIDDATIALVTFAKTAVTSAGFIVTEYYAIQKLFGNVRQIIDGVTVATLYLGKAQLALPNAIGIGTEAYKANDDAIQRLMVTMVARGKSLQDADKAQANVNTASAGYVKTLDQMVLAMEAARGTQGSLATDAAAAGAALSGAGTAAGTAGTRMAGAFLSGEKAAKALAKTTKELADEQQKFLDLTDAASVKGWADELERVDDLARLDRQALYDMNLELDRQEQSVKDLTLAHADAAANRYLQDELELYRFQTEALKAQQRVLSEVNNENALKQMAQDAGVSVDQLVPKLSRWQDDIAALSQSFAQLGQIGGTSLTAISRGVGTAITGLNVGLNSITSLKNGFSALGSGSILKGITGLASGIAGIVGVADLATRGIAALINKLKGGEEGTLVNPARDAILAGFGAGGTGIGSGFGNLAAKLTELTGEAGGGKLFEAFTKADTMAEFDTAWAAIQKVFADTKTNAQTLEPLIDGVTAANETFNMSLSGSDEAIKELGQTQLSVTDMMLKGFSRLIEKLDEMIARLGVAGSMASNLVGADLAIGGERGSGEPTAQMYDEVPGFAKGTGGQYRDFGAGTLAMLHGKERVVPQGEDLGGDVTVIVQNVHTSDAAAFIRDLPTAVRQNRNGLRTGLRVALGVA